MPNLLVSWIAWYADFDLNTGEVAGQSPTFNLYQTGFAASYNRHLLLSTGEPGDYRSELLYTEIKRRFPEPGCELQLAYPGVKDILDFQEIKAVVEGVLAPYREQEIDILFSSGTTVMRMVWVLFHLEKNGFKTRLLQALDKQMGNGQVGYRVMNLRGSTIAGRLDALEAEREKLPASHLVPPFLQPVYEEAGEIARAPGIPVLIQGPSGSGKELLAAHIHQQSARHERPFIPVNCAAIGNDLLESRLFGFKKGVFTGAERDQTGFFEKADGGTLFLDEIGDMSTFLQQALLRVLQEKKVTRIGEVKERPVDVRIIAATNRDLVEACEAGAFRWDLYYRLAVVELHLPPLRAYPLADRRAFIEHFLQQRQALSKVGMPLQLAPEVEAYLLSYIFSTAISISAVIFVLLSEMYPNKIRGLAMSIAGFSLWVGTYLVGQLTPWFLENLGPSGTFLFFALMCFPYLYIIWRKIPETAGMSLEDIESYWLGDKNEKTNAS